MKSTVVSSSSLPTQFELATLAAALKRTLQTDPRNLVAANAELIETALDLWHAAGKKLETDSHLDRVSRYRLKIIGRFSESILVGKHLLPAIPESFLLVDHCEFDEFLSMAVGLSERTDRLRWFRAFLAGWHDPNVSVLGFGHKSDGTALYPSFFETAQQELPARITGIWVRKHPIDPFGIHESKEYNIPELLESFRIEGVDEPVAMTAAFRSWRLTMMTSEKKAEKPYDLDVCIALAKAK